MSSSATYHFSVNTGIIDKPDRSAGVNFGHGWEPRELSLDELAEAVGLGHAVAPQYRGGRRRTSNYIQAGFLAADIDRGLPLDEAGAHALVRQHAGLTHTTVSHVAENHRFRIIFPLDEPIMSARDWADAQFGVALTLGSDLSVSDGARLFLATPEPSFFASVGPCRRASSPT